MLGVLPKALTVNGHKYAIATDFRVILKIIAAYQDAELLDREKVYVCLKALYGDGLKDIPSHDYPAAYKAAIEFIEGFLHNEDNHPSPKVINWVKDEHLIFPEINKIAGCEVRTVQYLHWWTFLGYLQAVDHNGLWGSILSIRYKKATRKKLESYEQEFYNANRDLCSVEERRTDRTPEDDLAAIYQSLLNGGDGNG